MYYTQMHQVCRYNTLVNGDGWKGEIIYLGHRIMWWNMDYVQCDWQYWHLRYPQFAVKKRFMQANNEFDFGLFFFVRRGKLRVRHGYGQRQRIVHKREKILRVIDWRELENKRVNDGFIAAVSSLRDAIREAGRPVPPNNDDLAQYAPHDLLELMPPGVINMSKKRPRHYDQQLQAPQIWKTREPRYVSALLLGRRKIGDVVIQLTQYGDDDFFYEAFIPSPYQFTKHQLLAAYRFRIYENAVKAYILDTVTLLEPLSREHIHMPRSQTPYVDAAEYAGLRPVNKD